MNKPKEPDKNDHTASEAQQPEMQSDGLSFEAEPTGLDNTDTPATTDAGEPERFDTSQGATTSRPGYTPGPDEASDTQAAARPRGLSSIVLLIVLAMLLIVALFLIFG
ncbi:MAG TPA: hypothetical protein VKP65_14880 [Rhodothermales bacterium]|nr:hypothetical protein [Rhodothermales bacterium]